MYTLLIIAAGFAPPGIAPCTLSRSRMLFSGIACSLSFSATRVLFGKKGSFRAFQVKEELVMLVLALIRGGKLFVIFPIPPTLVLPAPAAAPGSGVLLQALPKQSISIPRTPRRRAISGMRGLVSGVSISVMWQG